MCTEQVRKQCSLTRERSWELLLHAGSAPQAVHKTETYARYNHLDVKFKHLKIGDISVSASYSCLLNIRGLSEDPPLGLGVYLVSPWRCRAQQSTASCFLWESCLSQMFTHHPEIREFRWSSSKDQYFKWNILLRCRELQCSEDRIKTSDSPVCWREGKLGQKEEQCQRNRWTKWGRQEEDTKSDVRVEETQAHEGSNSDHVAQGAPAALSPAQKGTRQANTGVSRRQRDLTLRTRTSTRSMLLLFLQIDTNPHRSKTWPWYVDYFEYFFLFLWTLHLTITWSAVLLQRCFV